MSINLFTHIPRAMVSLAVLCFSALLPNIATAEDYSVEINKTKIMHLPAPAGAIIVGNPKIADITVHSPTLLFILGRGYGVTNVIILDDLGNTILEADIQVGGNQTGSGKRLLMAGQGWQSYDCAPFCQPAPVLGDDPNFLANFKGRGQAINNTGTPITTTPFAGPGNSIGALNNTLPAAASSFANATSQPAPRVTMPQVPAPTAKNSGSGRGVEY